MVLKKIIICLVVLFLISCEDLMSILYLENDSNGAGTLKNRTNVNNEGKGESEGNVTIIVNNSTWYIDANIYKANGDKSFLRTIHMNKRGSNFDFNDPSTITIEYAPIYIELTSYKDSIKANLNTKNYIYFLDK
jgi:hypothetical protein